MFDNSWSGLGLWQHITLCLQLRTFRLPQTKLCCRSEVFICSRDPTGKFQCSFRQYSHSESPPTSIHRHPSLRVHKPFLSSYHRINELTHCIK
ncbi:hypothetical protein ATANTOWER_021064 [Ataeniobius toweri]|uniref:Uncharacterized protein n=1 Tax=Ataeniobius toweri TaxID=208326 RepID=A0ABU7B0K3_9TELE|nr:hypothetical protein [Ataeniobius toweri]